MKTQTEKKAMKQKVIQMQRDRQRALSAEVKEAPAPEDRMADVDSAFPSDIQRGATMEVPRALYLAVKAVARSQQMPVTYAVREALMLWIREQPAWRQFLAEQGARPEASERGAIRD
jgi:hypothetical protein